MSFWGTMAADFGSSFMKTLGGGAASYGSGRIFQGEGESRGQARKNYHTDMKAQQFWTEKNAKLGRDLDVGAQQEMFDFRMQRAKEAGLTNVEAFGSPASGAGGGTGAATTTLGNSAASSGAQMRQSAMQAKIAAEENQKDRMTTLAQTAMQTETQKEVAETQAGATTGAAQTAADAAIANKAVDKAIADGRLKLDRDALNENIKLIASQISKNEHEVQKLVNDIATSTPKWQLMMKQLTMGPDNLLVEAVLQHHDVTIHEIRNMPVEQRKALIAQMIALKSHVYTEAKGAEALGKGVADSSLVGNSIQTILNQLGLGDTESDMELTEERPPSLGSRMSEPMGYGPGRR